MSGSLPLASPGPRSPAPRSPAARSPFATTRGKESMRSFSGSGQHPSSEVTKKVEKLKQEKMIMEQKARERDRIREENERTRLKEKELKHAEEERKRAEREAKQRELDRKRQEAVDAKLMVRQRSAEHQTKILRAIQEDIEAKNQRREISIDRIKRELLSRHDRGELAGNPTLDAKQSALRRTFVLLDVNSDGVVSASDVRNRLLSLNCKMSKQAVDAMMSEVLDVYGEKATGKGVSKWHWTWAKFMHQPRRGEFTGLPTPHWSTLNEKGSAEHPSLNQSSSLLTADSEGQAAPKGETHKRLFHTPETITHIEEIQAWTETWKNRIVTVDGIDCSTKHDIQHPPTLSPRNPLDMVPQDPKRPEVCPVVLTQHGLMTEVDWKAHVARPKPGLTWTEFRDCFLMYSFDLANAVPDQFYSIVEFLMVDNHGSGTARLEDVMELLFRRFGVPSDAMFTKLFGNSCDPNEHLSLKTYLDKVKKMVAHKRESEAQAEARAISSAERKSRTSSRANTPAEKKRAQVT